MWDNSQIFVKNGVPLEFVMRTCHARTEIKLLVEQNGGVFRWKGGVNVFRIADPAGQFSYDDKGRVISAQYVYDCIEQNRLLDVEFYIVESKPEVILPDTVNSSTEISNPSTVCHDVNKKIIQYILSHQQNFINLSRPDFLKKLEFDEGITFPNPREFTSHVRHICKLIDSYNLPADHISTFMNLCTFKNVLPFYKTDDMKILNYIVNNDSYELVKGPDLWDEMVVNQVTEHSAKSMCIRFHHTILPNLGKYHLSPGKLKKLQSYANIMSSKSDCDKKLDLKISASKIKQQLKIKMSGGYQNSDKEFPTSNSDRNLLHTTSDREKQFSDFEKFRNPKISKNNKIIFVPRKLHRGVMAFKLYRIPDVSKPDNVSEPGNVNEPDNVSKPEGNDNETNVSRDVSIDGLRRTLDFKLSPTINSLKTIKFEPGISPSNSTRVCHQSIMPGSSKIDVGKDVKVQYKEESLPDNSIPMDCNDSGPLNATPNEELESGPSSFDGQQNLSEYIDKCKPSTSRDSQNVSIANLRKTLVFKLSPEVSDSNCTTIVTQRTSPNNPITNDLHESSEMNSPQTSITIKQELNFEDEDNGHQMSNTCVSEISQTSKDSMVDEQRTSCSSHDVSFDRTRDCELDLDIKTSNNVPSSDDDTLDFSTDDSNQTIEADSFEMNGESNFDLQHESTFKTVPIDNVCPNATVDSNSCRMFNIKNAMKLKLQTSKDMTECQSELKSSTNILTHGLCKTLQFHSDIDNINAESKVADNILDLSIDIRRNSPELNDLQIKNIANSIKLECHTSSNDVSMEHQTLNITHPDEFDIGNIKHELRSSQDTEDSTINYEHSTSDYNRKQQHNPDIQDVSLKSLRKNLVFKLNPTIGKIQSPVQLESTSANDIVEPSIGHLSKMFKGDNTRSSIKVGCHSSLQSASNIPISKSCQTLGPTDSNIKPKVKPSQDIPGHTIDSESEHQIRESIIGLRKNLESKIIKLENIRKRFSNKIMIEDFPVQMPPGFYRSKLETLAKPQTDPISDICNVTMLNKFKSNLKTATA